MGYTPFSQQASFLENHSLCKNQISFFFSSVPCLPCIFASFTPYPRPASLSQSLRLRERQFRMNLFLYDLSCTNFLRLYPFQPAAPSLSSLLRKNHHCQSTFENLLTCEVCVLRALCQLAIFANFHTFPLACLAIVGVAVAGRAALS